MKSPCQEAIWRCSSKSMRRLASPHAAIVALCTATTNIFVKSRSIRSTHTKGHNEKVMASTRLHYPNELPELVPGLVGHFIRLLFPGVKRFQSFVVHDAHHGNFALIPSAAELLIDEGIVESRFRGVVF